MERIKWLIVFILLVVAGVLNFLYRNDNSFLNNSFIILIITIVGYIALITNKGKSIIIFIRESFFELKKVVWPSYQETFHITLIVAAVTIVISLIIWGLDSTLVYIISIISSLRF